MDAVIFRLGSFNGGAVYDFKCHACIGSKSGREYTSSFTLVYVRKGNFTYNCFRKTLDVYSDFVLFKKPGYDYTVSHNHLGEKDHCTFIEFRQEFIDELKSYLSPAMHKFLSNPDQDVTLLPSSPLIHYLSHHIFSEGTHQSPQPIHFETLVWELVGSTFRGGNVGIKVDLDPKRKVYYLDALDQVKTFINTNLTEPIRIEDMAKVANMSQYHFIRVFKSFTNRSPYQHLLMTRLDYAALLLLNTQLQVQEIAYGSGFSSPEYFVNIFKAKFGRYPTEFRSLG